MRIGLLCTYVRESVKEERAARSIDRPLLRSVDQWMDVKPLAGLPMSTHESERHLTQQREGGSLSTAPVSWLGLQARRPRPRTPE